MIWNVVAWSMEFHLGDLLDEFAFELLSNEGAKEKMWVSG